MQLKIIMKKGVVFEIVPLSPATVNSKHFLHYFLSTANNSWTSLQVIELCEKLSGQRSKISQVPIYLLKLAREITNFFQWSWNISERLAFTEVINRGDNFNTSMNEVYNLLQIQHDETTHLENYLQEYFAKVMKKLKELNYKIGEESSKIEF